MQVHLRSIQAQPGINITKKMQIVCAVPLTHPNYVNQGPTATSSFISGSKFL